MRRKPQWWSVYFVVLVTTFYTYWMFTKHQPRQSNDQKLSDYSMNDFAANEFYDFEDPDEVRRPVLVDLNKKSQNSKCDGSSVTILTYVERWELNEGKYNQGLATLNCYARAHGYRLRVIAESKSMPIVDKCADIVKPTYRKLCIFSHYMKLSIARNTFVLVVPPSMFVVNMELCIESMIHLDDKKQIYFHENFNELGISADTMLLKNTLQNRVFLDLYAGYQAAEKTSLKTEFTTLTSSSATFQLHILVTFFGGRTEAVDECQTLMHGIQSMQKFREFIACTHNLRSLKVPSSTVAVLPRGQSWLYDVGFYQPKSTCRRHIFMDTNQVQQTEYLRKFHCNPLPSSSAITPAVNECQSMKQFVKNMDETVGKRWNEFITNFMFVGDCWPEC